MRGCARFLVWLEPWLRRLVSEAARWARVGTRTVPNGQLRIDRARRGSNGHPSTAVGLTASGDEFGVSRDAAQNDAFEDCYETVTDTRRQLNHATWDGVLSPTHETRGASREVHVRLLSNEPRRRVRTPKSVARRDAETRRTHQHKPPTCAWRGGRRVQFTGTGRRHPVHRCSRHKLRTEITAERRRRQRSKAGLGRDDAAERETDPWSIARTDAMRGRAYGSRKQGQRWGRCKRHAASCRGSATGQLPTGIVVAPHSRTGSCDGGGLTGPCTCRARSSRSGRRP